MEQVVVNLLELGKGHYLAILAIALAVALPGFGSSLMVGKCGETSAGIVAELPDRFSKMLVFQLLPGTGGIYGLLIGFIIFMQIGGLSSGAYEPVSTAMGVAYVVGALPIAIVGCLGSIHQGKMSIAGMHLVAKRPNASGQAITMTVMIETYQVLALLMSFLVCMLGIRFVA